MATNKTFWFSAALCVLAAACGSDDNSGDGGTSGSADGGTNGGGGESLELTLVDVLAVDDSNPIATPHEVYLLDTETGEPIPGFEDPLFTEAVTGKVSASGIPTKFVSVYVVGNSEANPETYDAVSVSPLGSGETLLRISNVGLASTAEQTGGFTPRPDAAALGGTIYWTPGGPGNARRGTIGCAQLYLDDNNSPFDLDQDQRYSAGSGLPTAPMNQDRTLESGRFYFGNISPTAPGEVHTLRVTLDEGASFISETDFAIPNSRETARGGQGLIIYLLGLDVDAAENPSPATCDGLY